MVPRTMIIVSQIRVAVVDDEALVRRALRVFIGLDPSLTLVAEGATGAEAIELAKRHALDVILMDTQMPELSGIDATRQIMRLSSPPRVLMLTTFSADRHVIPALRAGASGYLVKDTEPIDIIQAVTDVYAGKSVISPAISERLAARVASEPDPPDDIVREPLTGRELEIIQLIAEGKSNAEIADALCIAEPTVKSAIGRILRKWNVRDRVQALIYAVSNGIVTIL